MKPIGILLALVLLIASTSCSRQRQLKSPCVAVQANGKNFAPCVRKAVNNVFLA